MNGERRKGGDKRQKEFKQERSRSERTNQLDWRGERGKTQDSTLHR